MVAVSVLRPAGRKARFVARSEKRHARWNIIANVRGPCGERSQTKETVRLDVKMPQKCPYLVACAIEWTDQFQGDDTECGTATGP